MKTTDYSRSFHSFCAATARRLAVPLFALFVLLCSHRAFAAEPLEISPEGIRRQALSIILPKVEFRGATIQEAVDFLKQKSLLLDPEAPRGAPRGALMLIPPPELQETKITLSLTDVPLWEALRYTAMIAHLKITIEKDNLELVPEDAAAPVKPVPAPVGGPTAEKLQKLVIPKLEFRDVSLAEALDFLRFKGTTVETTEQDPRRVNIVYVPPLPSAGVPPPPNITMQLVNTTLAAALKHVAEKASLELSVEEYAMVLRPRASKP